MVLFLSIIFLSAHALGLLTAQKYSNYIDQGVLAPIVENPADASNSAVILAYVLVVTLAVVLIIRFAKRLLLAVEALAIFFASDIVFEFMVPLDIAGTIPLGLVLALLLTAWKMLRPTILSQDVALVISVAGAGAVLGVSLEPLPVLILMLALSIYDFLSVFVTKHMVYMARAITEHPMAFTAAIPAKFSKPVLKTNLRTGKKVRSRFHVFQLGGGDIVIPLVFASSLLRYFGASYALAASAGAFVSILLLFFLVSKRPGRALPALPIVSAGAVWGFGIARLIGF